MLEFWLAEDDRNKVVSAISPVEARSAICRLPKENRMSPDDASVASAAIAAEVRRLIEQPVKPPVLDAANGLVDQYELRALDAVQLGSAVVVRNLLSASDMGFIASDHAFLRAAEAEGFNVWDPCSKTLVWPLE